MAHNPKTIRRSVRLSLYMRPTDALQDAQKFFFDSSNYLVEH